MAGYSGTPLPQKLGLRPNARFGVVAAPAGFGKTMGALPAGVKMKALAAGSDRYDVIVCFAQRMQL